MAGRNGGALLDIHQSYVLGEEGVVEPATARAKACGFLGDLVARQQQVAADQQHRVWAVEIKNFARSGPGSCRRLGPAGQGVIRRPDRRALRGQMSADVW